MDIIATHHVLKVQLQWYSYVLFRRLAVLNSVKHYQPKFLRFLYCHCQAHDWEILAHSKRSRRTRRDHTGARPLLSSCDLPSLSDISCSAFYQSVSSHSSHSSHATWINSCPFELRTFHQGKSDLDGLTPTATGSGGSLFLHMSWSESSTTGGTVT